MTGLSHKLANEAAGIDKDGSLTMNGFIDSIVSGVIAMNRRNLMDYPSF